jgi:GT2 family glycosyltransferase
MMPDKTVDKKTATCVCTYKRKDLLGVLMDSYAASEVQPGLVVIVDNDNDPAVREMCQELEAKLEAGAEVVYHGMAENTGGAGGFSMAVSIAYAKGAEWLWLMDDDVKVLPNALKDMQPFMSKAATQDRRVIQCRRLNADGAVFYWQYNFMNRLGIPNPIAPAGFKAGEKFRNMNTACFEGGLFHRSVVKELGLPDNRFFIYWDDTVYGYLASKVTQPILIADILMQRTRNIENIKIGSARRLNATSDMVRYYIMRNRGYMAKYFALHGDYNPVIFAFGTFLTLAKETIRLIITKNYRKGMKELRRGMRDARKIKRDKTWQPMPKLD